MLQITFALFFRRLNGVQFSIDFGDGVFQSLAPLVDFVQPIRNANVAATEKRNAETEQDSFLLVVFVPPGLVVRFVDQTSAVLSNLMRNISTSFGIVTTEEKRRRVVFFLVFERQTCD